MRPTLCLIASPSQSTTARVGDLVLVRLFDRNDPPEQLYRVTYADPQRLSLQIVLDMVELQHRLRELWGALLFDPDTAPPGMTTEALRVARNEIDQLLRLLEQHNG